MQIRGEWYECSVGILLIYSPSSLIDLVTPFAFSGTTIVIRSFDLRPELTRVMASESNPYVAPKTGPPLKPSRSSVAIATAWAAVVAFGGGFVCGWCVSQFGEFGSLSLAAGGALAGYVSRKITRQPSKLAGASQVIATCLMFFIAETCWLHWKTRNGEASWAAAISVWPLFIREYQLSALIGAAATAYGAWCAYGYAVAADYRAAELTPPVTLPP